MLRRVALPVVLALALAGCAEAPELVARGSDPGTPHEERVELLADALARREPGVVPDLVGRAESLIAAGGAEERAAALDVLEALGKPWEKTAQALAVRLADHESPFQRSRPALEVLAKHRDATVRGLAKEQLARLR